MRFRLAFFGLLIAFLVLAGRASHALEFRAPPASPVDPVALQSKVGELIAWIEKNSDYEIHNTPAILFITQEELEYVSFYPNETTGTEGLIAAYTNNVMFLTPNFQLGRDDYVLLHELVHHAQMLAGNEYPCTLAAEPEAYELQAKYVKETGRGELPGALFLAMLTCDMR